MPCSPRLCNLQIVGCPHHCTLLAHSRRPAGLGGSGQLNLLITNLGFGEPVFTLRGGRRTPQLIGGGATATVDFFHDASDIAFGRIGTRQVWAWPFPEVCTVGEALQIRGDSDVRMGTAPSIWNVVLERMAAALPRGLWRWPAFSQLLANFSAPLVALTDRYVGETHGVRVDVTAPCGATATAVQAHESFRTCVGQSCAEFVIHLLEREAQQRVPGVYLPEELLADDEQRAVALERMSTTPGTFTYRFECQDTRGLGSGAAEVPATEAVLP